MSARTKPAQREKRAKEHLKMLLHAATAVLTYDTSAAHADYQAEVRTAAAKTRKALDAGATAYDALIYGFVPLFFINGDDEEAAH